MKRNTQKAPAHAGLARGGSQTAFSRAQGPRPAEPGHADPSAAIQAAAALIALAMHESQIPVVELGNRRVELVVTVGKMRRLLRELDPEPAEVVGPGAD